MCCWGSPSQSWTAPGRSGIRSMTAHHGFLVMAHPSVTDMVEAVVIAIHAGASMETIADRMAPHPTLSEVITGTGLVALGRGRRRPPQVVNS
jgi:Pyridine nucleotide-disulphide oxidoreductase, dimerisation domain